MNDLVCRSRSFIIYYLQISKRGWSNTAAASNAIPPPRPTEDAEDRKILWPPVVVIMNTSYLNEDGQVYNNSKEQLLFLITHRAKNYIQLLVDECVFQLSWHKLVC